ncbi:hypothetical protein LRP88_02232 [Fusarium phalaenopsidis]
MLCPMALPPRLGLVVILLALLGLAAATSSSNADSPHSSSAPEIVQDAKSTVHQTLKALAVVNKDRINYLAFNKHEFKEVTAEQPAALLRYKSEPASLSRRNTAGDDDNSSLGYRIPTELSHAAPAEAARKKHSEEGSADTDTPKPRKTPEGLLSKFADSPKEKRASGYWIIDDQKHPGKSPYATPDYKVWRNFKDFGVKGDGKTDDPAAINKAIADGMRCGETCHSSITTLAVVYFPPGMYLPINVPTILAASSFVGLGVFTSNKHVADDVGISTQPTSYGTMQDFIIESCESGLVVTGGSGGPNSKGQIVDSLIIADSIIANTQNGIVTSLHAENATSLLVQNVGFFNIKTAISDSAKNRVLFRGGDEVHLDSWGFSKITDAKGISKFVNGERIPAMNRTEELLGTAYDKMRPNLFTRRRPKYYNVPNNKVMNVKALGAKGDGKTDDTAILNSILDGAANTFSIVYFPYGIMATGSRFEDERNPHIAVQVGRPGDAPGIIEIQDMLFTVSGPTAGAILVQWNAQEATKGSMGIWDCAKSTGSIDPKCKAASMLLHLTSGSTAYLEKVWAWAADHNIDDPKHTQILEVQQSDGLWIYNLCTKGTLEMVSPYNGNATLAKDNINGYLSSILAWLEGANRLRNVDVPDAWKKALSSKIICNQYITRFQEPSYRGSPDNEALTESICGKSCGKCLADWFNGVEAWCHGYNISRQLPTARGGRMWARVNETCVKDNKTGEYCNDIIDKFTEVDRIDEMPCSEVCSECYIKKLAMMQSSLYLAYDEWYQDDLKLVYKTCVKQGPTDIPPSLDPVPEDEPSTFCISDNFYRTSKGKSTCDKVALKNNLSPALYNLNLAIHNCGSIPAGTELCLPLACARLVKYSQKSNCTAIEKNEGLSPGSLRRFNPWINRECSNLNSGGNSFGWILCAEPQDGEMPQFGAGDDTVTPHPSSDYTAFPVNPPNNATAAPDTTAQCGRWHVTEEGDTYASICMSTGIHISLLLAANPSLGKEFLECSAKLVVERAYCTGPTYDWVK